jgi:large subunit ribosomal protein L32
VAVPKRKKSKSKVRMRRANVKIASPNLRPCPKCGAFVLSHKVCPECNTYKGRLIFEKKAPVVEA